MYKNRCCSVFASNKGKGVGLFSFWSSTSCHFCQDVKLKRKKCQQQQQQETNKLFCPLMLDTLEQSHNNKKLHHKLYF